MTEAELEAAGWHKLPTRRFSAAVGSAWMKGEPGQRILALLTDENSGNEHMGTVHGGAMMTFADMAFGAAVVDAIGRPHCATAQLNFQFTASARTGSMITCEPEVVRQTSQLVFLRALMKCGDRVIGSADGIFKVLEPEKIASMRAR